MTKLMSAMPALTAVVLAAFVGYIGAWYTGAIEGNFALVMLLATFVTGVYWVAEKFLFLPQRQRAAQKLEQQAQARTAQLQRQGIAQHDVNVDASKEHLLRQPWWLDWTAGLFPVLFVVFVLRSFLFEPFKIPSGSMIPTLLVGDLILVNKFTYGVRLPVINKKITEGQAVARGDVIVFRYPPQPSLDYIKRVVGLPGDKIAFRDQTLFVNGEAVAKRAGGVYVGTGFGREMTGATLYEVDLPGQPHRSLEIGPFGDPRAEGEWEVKPGHYFVMGDNRDRSADSRYWGQVPESALVGKAFAIWLNCEGWFCSGAFDYTRIGDTIR